MNQLQQYADETEKRWTTNAQISTTPELLHHHYQFMGRLQHAILLQENVLRASEDRVKLAQQQLLQAEFRIASLKQVLVKRQAEVEKRLQRRDQKQMDEFASMQILRQVRQKLEHNHEH
ncbi:MAG: flagellar FliJ protein [Comamonadaceae bacterium]|nr:MAG: flagellar FliJ protein [Comamonadaceae bacterium]